MCPRILICAIFLSITHFGVVAKNIQVGSISELTDATASASEGDTISLKDGTYKVQSYGVTIRTDGITVKGLSGAREKVIITGDGMNGDIQYGFWIAGDHVTIRDLTIQNVIYHCIQTDVNTDGLKVINCHLRDAREQLLKVPYSSSVNDFSDSGLVENCLFEFSKGVTEQYYTGGIDCHYNRNWVIRNNTFKNIRSPENQIAEHAIHFWTNSENILVENNVIINCDRGIGFGLGDVAHKGGIVRNNMIYHGVISGIDNADVGIALETCTDVQVYNNTIFFENSYPNAIEYRFEATKGIYIANNLTNKTIRQRDGASATVTSNITDAKAEWFRSAASGDLHLSSQVQSVQTGLAITGLDKDIDGEIRPAVNIDIGADQFSTVGLKSNIYMVNKKMPPQKRLFLRSTSTGRLPLSFSILHNLNGRKIKATNASGVIFDRDVAE